MRGALVGAHVETYAVCSRTTATTAAATAVAAANTVKPPGETLDLAYTWKHSVNGVGSTG